MIRGIFIRRLEINDLPGIAGLMHFVRDSGTSRQFPWNVEHIASLLSTDMNLSYVALQRKKLAGFLIASAEENSDPPSASIACLAVVPGMDGKGVEEKLLDSLKKEMVHRHIYSVGVELPGDNNDMITVFKNYGYSTDSRRVMMRYHVHATREEHT